MLSQWQFFLALVGATTCWTMKHFFLLNTFWPILKLSRLLGQFSCKAETDNGVKRLEPISGCPYRFWLIHAFLLVSNVGAMYYFTRANNASMFDLLYTFLLFSINETTTERWTYQISFAIFFTMGTGLKLQQGKICRDLCRFQDYLLNHMKAMDRKLTNKIKWNYYVMLIESTIAVTVTGICTLLQCCD